MSIRERELKRYLRQIKKVLPSRELKKRLIPQTSQSICNYMEAHPEADLKMLQGHFGTPYEIAGSYLDQQETAVLLRKLNIRRKILAIIAGALATMLVVWLGSAALITVIGRHIERPKHYIYVEK